MDRALYRACAAVPPSSLSELPRPAGRVALHCVRSDCPGCAQDHSAFESTLHATVVPWNCDDPRARQLALEAGVTRTPAYVVLEGSEHRVVYP